MTTTIALAGKGGVGKTTICGMIPVTLSGTTSIGLSYTSFGLTLIGGLTTATLLTLLVVPVFYTLFDDLGVAIPSFLNALRKRGAASSSDLPAESTDLSPGV